MINEVLVRPLKFIVVKLAEYILQNSQIAQLILKYELHNRRFYEIKNFFSRRYR